MHNNYCGNDEWSTVNSLSLSLHSSPDEEFYVSPEDLMEDDPITSQPSQHADYQAAGSMDTPAQPVTEDKHAIPVEPDRPEIPILATADDEDKKPIL